MPDPVDLIGTCPVPELFEAILLKNCPVNIKDITRILLKRVDVPDIFNDDGSGPWPTPGVPLVDATALLASIEDQTRWDTLFTVADPNESRGTITPKIQNAIREKVLIEPVELPNTDRLLPGTLPDTLSTYTMSGISSADHMAMIAFAGVQLDFMLIDFVGNTLYKNLTDAEVAAGESPWFRAKLFNVSSRDVQTGAANVDNVDIQIFNGFAEQDNYATANTQSFGLTIGLV